LGQVDNSNRSELCTCVLFITYTSVHSSSEKCGAVHGAERPIAAEKRMFVGHIMGFALV